MLRIAVAGIHGHAARTVQRQRHRGARPGDGVAAERDDPLLAAVRDRHAAAGDVADIGRGIGDPDPADGRQVAMGGDC